MEESVFPFWVTLSDYIFFFFFFLFFFKWKVEN